MNSEDESALTPTDGEAEERSCTEDAEYAAPRRLSPPSASALLNATNDGLPLFYASLLIKTVALG